MEERIREIHAALIEEHGGVERSGDRDEIDSLIHAILSQNVSNSNRRAGWESLLERDGREYEAIDHADHDELAETIRSAGLQNQKADRIQAGGAFGGR